MIARLSFMISLVLLFASPCLARELIIDYVNEDGELQTLFIDRYESDTQTHYEIFNGNSGQYSDIYIERPERDSSPGQGFWFNQRGR